MSKILYHIHQISKSYNGRCVLHVGELDIYQGEILALVGPSGAGKSTLLRLLNYLEMPTTGSIAYKGIPYSASKEIPIPLRRQITTVFQRPLLLNRSVWANVNFGLHLRSAKSKDELTLAALKKVRLEPLGRQRARTLSGGEAQRVALARAIVLQPDVLLLDEPTANLDPYNVCLIEETVLTLNREQGTTLVLVTHNIFQARRIAQRVALLMDGQIVEVQDVDAFFNRPMDKRTASFVRGEMVY